MSELLKSINSSLKGLNSRIRKRNSTVSSEVSFEISLPRSPVNEEALTPASKDKIFDEIDPQYFDPDF